MAIVYSKNPSLNRKVAKTEKLPSGARRPLWPYVFATYREVGATCPLRCSFHPSHGADNQDDRRVHGELCYATKGRVTMHAKKGTPDESDGDTVYRMVQGLPPGTSVRHHVSGDVYTNNTLDWDYFTRLCEAHEARPDVSGWLYTHGSMVDFLLMQSRAPANLSVNWSCDSLEDAQAAADEGVVGLTAVLPKGTVRSTGVTICPEQTSGIPCAVCQLCWKADRKTIVGFIAH
jgi:hypothetical protein